MILNNKLTNVNYSTQGGHQLGHPHKGWGKEMNNCSKGKHLILSPLHPLPPHLIQFRHSLANQRMFLRRWRHSLCQIARCLYLSSSRMTAHWPRPHHTLSWTFGSITLLSEVCVRVCVGRGGRDVCVWGGEGGRMGCVCEVQVHVGMEASKTNQTRWE